MESVALRDGSEPAGNMGYSTLFGMENSCRRVLKKSFAVRKSPSEPARWGLVAYLRDATIALAEFGIVLGKPIGDSYIRARGGAYRKKFSANWLLGIWPSMAQECRSSVEANSH